MNSNFFQIRQMNITTYTYLDVEISFVDQTFWCSSYRCLYTFICLAWIYWLYTIHTSKYIPKYIYYIYIYLNWNQVVPFISQNRTFLNAPCITSAKVCMRCFFLILAYKGVAKVRIEKLKNKQILTSTLGLLIN